MKLVVLVKYESTGANLQLSLIKICFVKKATTQSKSFICLTISERDLYNYEVVTSRRAPSQIKLQFR